MPVTIQRVIDDVLAQIPGAPRSASVDTVKCGDPARELTGIVVTFTVTFDVIRKAKELGANFIITHEPTYYNHHDRTEPFAGDSVYEAKRRLLEKFGLSVWRFHDYWHERKPDGILTGVTEALGWEVYVDSERPAYAVVPQISLRELAYELKNKLSLPFVRIAGNPDMPCSRIGMLLGAVGPEMQIQYLRRDDVDVVVCGETTEWQTCEYVRDANGCGRDRGLIVLGHFGSEDEGMRYCAEWLRTLLPGVAVTYMPAGDPLTLLV